MATPRAQLRSGLLLLGFLLSAFFVPGIGRRSAAAQQVPSDVGIAPPATESSRVSVLIELSQPPAAVTYGQALRQNAALPEAADGGLPGAAVRVNAPAGIFGFYVAGTAAFGTTPPPGGVPGNVVLALDLADGAGPSTTDACSALTNAAAVAGNIALVDRGTCDFVIKVKNAQDAGAIAVVVANSAAGVFGNMAGMDPVIVIPSVMVTFADGNTFKANIPGLNITLFPAASGPPRPPEGLAVSGRPRCLSAIR
jgi:hypothetical protein